MQLYNAFALRNQPEFDDDVATDEIGVILTDDDNVELPSLDLSSRGRFCFFFIGSPKLELSKVRFPFESYESDLFTFILSQSEFAFDNLMLLVSSVNELRKVSFIKSSFIR